MKETNILKIIIIALIPTRILLILLGWIIVPIALPFAKEGDWSKTKKWTSQMRWLCWRNPVNNLRGTSIYSVNLSKMTSEYPYYVATYDVENRFRLAGTWREGFLMC